MLSLATANVAYMAPAPASMLATGMRSSVTTMQADLKGFQDPDVVAKDAATAAKSGEFCYGLPGSIAPIKDFDPFQYTNDATFEQVPHRPPSVRLPHTPRNPLPCGAAAHRALSSRRLRRRLGPFAPCAVPLVGPV